MLELSGKPLGTLQVPSQAFFGHGFEEIEVRVPDLKKLEEVLQFRAEISLADGLSRVLEHWGLLADEDEQHGGDEAARGHDGPRRH